MTRAGTYSFRLESAVANLAVEVLQMRSVLLACSISALGVLGCGGVHSAPLTLTLTPNQTTISRSMDAADNSFGAWVATRSDGKLITDSTATVDNKCAFAGTYTTPYDGSTAVIVHCGYFCLGTNTYNVTATAAAGTIKASGTVTCIVHQ